MLGCNLSLQEILWETSWLSFYQDICVNMLDGNHCFTFMVCVICLFTSLPLKKARSSIGADQTVIQAQRDLCFTPLPHGCHPPAINQVWTKVKPTQGCATLMESATPMMCPHWHVTPPPRCGVWRWRQWSTLAKSLVFQFELLERMESGQLSIHVRFPHVMTRWITYHQPVTKFGALSSCSFQACLSHAGAAAVTWYTAFVLLVFDTPDNHPRISKSEQEYIEESIAQQFTKEKVRTRTCLGVLAPAKKKKKTNNERKKTNTNFAKGDSPFVIWIFLCFPEFKFFS